MTACRGIVVRSIVLATAMTHASGATADVYKCAGDGGAPVYQESPCPPGKELRNFQVDPPEITVLPAPAVVNPRDPRTTGAPAPKGNVNRDFDAKRPNVVKGDAAERKHIRAGMSEAEVLARLGQPDATSGAKGGKSVRWSYLPAPGDQETITSVTFKHGKVTQVERRIVRK